MGRMIDRIHRELTGCDEDGKLIAESDIDRIALTYHAWRGDKGADKYQDVAGFCKSAKLDDIRANGFVLTPGRYVGAEEAEDDGEPFEEKMKRLTMRLKEQLAHSAALEKQIRKNLASIKHEL